MLLFWLLQSFSDLSSHRKIQDLKCGAWLPGLEQGWWRDLARTLSLTIIAIVLISHISIIIIIAVIVIIVVVMLLCVSLSQPNHSNQMATHSEPGSA